MSKYSTLTIVGKYGSGKTSMVKAYIDKFPATEKLSYEIHDFLIPAFRDKTRTYKKIVTLEEFPHE